VLSGVSFCVLELAPWQKEAEMSGFAQFINAKMQIVVKITQKAIEITASAPAGAVIILAAIVLIGGVLWWRSRRKSSKQTPPAAGTALAAA
jgi:predicted ABC-type exoprotein transport system permease subunit